MPRPAELGLALLALAGAGPLHAGDFEASLFAGLTVPTYEQTFQYDPGSLIPPIPGISIRQEGVFALDAKGGLAAGGALAYFPSKAFGFELRLDTVSADVDVSGVKFTASVTLPPPLPPLSSSVDLTKGQMEVNRLTPISLGVKLRSPGPLRVSASGGVSYLPTLRATLEQTIGIGIPSLRVPSLDLTTLSITAEGEPTDGGSAWGWHVGAGIEVPVGKTVAVVVDARFFRYGKQLLTWSATAGDHPLSPAEERLLEIARERLPPVEFNPTFFQATAGLAIRF
jgi:hypothetical protein